METNYQYISGTFVNYYFNCKRQLWLFSKHIKMETTSDIVAIGKLIHENSYKREKKEIIIDNIKIDFIKKSRDGKIVIHEVKKANSSPESHKYQLLYYLYLLKKKGINAVGELNYPKQKRKQNFELDLKEEEKIENVLNDINKIIQLEKPPEALLIKNCKACSYNEFCWS